MPLKTLAAILITMLSATFVFAGPPAPPAGWAEGYVLANNIRIHYWRTGGNKPVMVMAHGSSDDGLCWTNLAKEFTSEYDIIMFDARGHGMSDPPMPGDPPDAQAEDLAALIRELKLSKPIVMGHSMGSASAAWFASKYPDVPRAVILEDPGLVRRPGTAPGGAAADATPEQRRAAMIARNNRSYDDYVADCMKNSPKWGRSECEVWAPSKRLHHPNTALVGMAGRPPMKELLPRITAPTLILKADAQGDLRRENEEIAKLLPHGKIVHIEGAAHNVRRDEKQKTIAAMRDFLRGL